MHLSSNTYRLDGAASCSHCLVVASPVKQSHTVLRDHKRFVCTGVYTYIFTHNINIIWGSPPKGSLVFISCFESSSRGLLPGTEALVRTLDSVNFSFFLSMIMQLYVKLGRSSSNILKVSSTLGRKGIEAHMTRQLGTFAHPKECIMPVEQW